MVTTVFRLVLTFNMNSLPVIVSDGEDDIIVPSRSPVLKRKARNLLGSDSEDDFADIPRTQRKRSKIGPPKIKVHKVEIIRPARPAVASAVEAVPTSAAARLPSAPPPPPESAAQYFGEFCDGDYHVSTPERAVTPGLSKAELLEYDQDAQPLFDETEVALMGSEHLFTEFPSFNVLCDSAVVNTRFALQQDYYSPKDKNNRLLRCSYAVVDEYSRKFMAVGLNPLKKFKPTVCLAFESASLEIKDHVPMMRELRGIKRRLVKTVGRNDGMLLTCGNLQATLVANRRVRISVPRINVRSLKPHELVILSEDEIDRVLESEAFLTSKIKMLQENADNLQEKYLQLLQSLAVRIIKKRLDDSMLKEHIRREILIVEDNFLNDCWWEMFIYYSYKFKFDAKDVLMYIKRKDELVVAF